MNTVLQKEDILGKLIITIDGPAGSGKSTTASILAERLGLTYLDTGAMYRAVAFAVLKEGIDPGDESSVSRIASSANIELISDNGKQIILLDGVDISREIRGPDISRVVSPVSKYAGVRKAMVKLQRKTGAPGGVVVEGRDTGSVVFPFAHLKVFLIADLEARAQRRKAQLGEMGISQDIDDIRENISSRDVIDSSRDHSPLLKPTGAYAVDTTRLSIEEQVAEIEQHARKTAEKLAGLAAGKGERNAFARAHIYYRISQFAVRLFYRMFFGLRIYGRENLRYRENFIFASNHLSYADPPVVGCTFDREVWFMAKKELFKNRLFAWLIRTYRAIPVDRVEVDRKTMRIILGNLKEGDSVLMFPEGTRSRDGSIRNLKSGLGFIAMQAGVSILPVYVRGSNSLLKCFFRRERLQVFLGPPIRIPEDYVPDDKKQDYRVLSSMVRNEMEMLKGLTDA
jgi:cytidylate kinase